MKLPYSPWDLLPIKAPLYETPDKMFFYDKVVKYLIPDILRIINTGITIDLNRVQELKDVVQTTIEQNKQTLANNSIIKEYLDKKKEILLQKKFKEQLDKCKTYKDYLTNFDGSKVEHRNYLINYCLTKNNLEKYTLPKWTIKDLKTLYGVLNKQFILDIINKNYTNLKEECKEAMVILAKTKASLYNKARMKPVEDYKETLKTLEFNTSSSLQKNELFDMLEVNTLNYTDAGNKQIDRAELERLLIEFKLYENPNEEALAFKEIIEVMINNSNANIINNSFIPAFEQFSINNTLFSNFKIFGTKTFRLTSNSPNLLQIPSSGNIFAKAVKECLIAPEGYVIYAIDAAGLEDRVMANHSKDPNKLSIYLEDVDGHCLASYFYEPKRVENILSRYEEEELNDYIKRYKQEIDNGNKELKFIRQDRKPCTFALSYGAGVEKIANMLNCSIEEAEEIYNNYHYKLYPKITELRNEILYKAQEDGYIHLGLGCYIHSSNPERELRTLANSYCQFWSILTLLTINKMFHLIDYHGYTDDIKITCTIYDSIYFIVKKDSKIIKWLNDTIVPIFTKDYLEDQIISNEAEGTIGINWYDQFAIPNNADLEKISSILDKIDSIE